MIRSGHNRPHFTLLLSLCLAYAIVKITGVSLVAANEQHHHIPAEDFISVIPTHEFRLPVS